MLLTGDGNIEIQAKINLMTMEQKREKDRWERDTIELTHSHCEDFSCWKRRTVLRVRNIFCNDRWKEFNPVSSVVVHFDERRTSKKLGQSFRHRSLSHFLSFSVSTRNVKTIYRSTRWRPGLGRSTLNERSSEYS